MKSSFFRLSGALSVCLIILLFPRHVQAKGEVHPSPRIVESLDEDWRFHLGRADDAIAPDYNDSAWRRVNVPHDYVVEGKFTPTTEHQDPGRPADWYVLHGFLPLQPAVYRKALAIPSQTKGQRVWLEFDGVFSNSHYYINGKEVGSQYSGYTRSRFDITDAISAKGRNVLVVLIDPRYDGWWYEGGGIYRHVRLVVVDPIHISPDGVFVSSTLSPRENSDRCDAQISIHTDITNSDSSSVSAVVTNEVLDARDQVVGTASEVERLAAGNSVTANQTVRLAQAQLWSPNRPSLYHLRSTVRVGQKIVDQVVTNLGIRDVRFDSEHGLFLNGAPVKLQGVNMHEDHAGVGVAMPDRLITWRLERLKELGCNAIRLSHNPVSPFLLDECDRLGFLVVAENRHLGDTFEDQTQKGTAAIQNRDLSALVMRDRNHPSIILWSLCNEQWIQGTPEAAAMVRAMKQRVHELDPTRLVTAAMNGGFDSLQGFLGVLDVVGINYHPDVYDSVHALVPKTPLFASEIASEISTRGVYASEHWESYFGDRERGYVSAYSINAGPGGQTVENAWPPVATRDFVAGGFVWAGFDYKGEPRPFGWPVINSHYGIMDICGFPKDSYFYYKSCWTHEPVLHLFPHWNWPDKIGQEIPVWIYSNCAEVELFLNGNSLGRQKAKRLYHLEWKVKYKPGTLSAKGYDSAGKQIAEAKVETSGPVATLQLQPDRRVLSADGKDLAVFTVSARDAQGRPVPIAQNLLYFTLRGPGEIIGVGNGDPSSHEPDKFVVNDFRGDSKRSEKGETSSKSEPANWSRSLFNGLAQVLVQSTRDPGEVTLMATTSGVPPASCSIETASPAALASTK